MKTLCEQSRKLLVDRTGSVSLLVLFSFSIVFASLALSVDAVRYFTLSSRLQNIARTGAIFAAENSNLLSVENITSMVHQMASLEMGANLLPSLGTAVGAVENVSVISQNNDQEFTVTVQAAFSTVFMQIFSGFNSIVIEKSATAIAVLNDLEIVLVIDRSLQTSGAGKLAGIKMAASTLTALITDVGNTGSQTVKLGFIPYGSAVINVKSFSEWVDIANWPTSFPPAVPGVVGWLGPLEQQRWCVGRRGESISKTEPPSVAKFPLFLEIGVTAGTVPAEDHYFIATAQDCSDVEIRPLEKIIANMDSYFASLVAAGEGANGTALNWAERMLSPNWSTDWSLPVGAIAPYSGSVKKIVVLINASGNDTSLLEDQYLIESCNRMKSKDVAILVVDYGSPTAMGELLKNCAANGGHYRFVISENDLVGSMKDIVKSLRTVNLVSVN